MAEPQDLTGARYRPSYIDAGDLLEPNYETMDVNEIFLGDLEELASFQDLIDFTNEDDRVDMDRPDRLQLLNVIQRAEGKLDGYVGRRYKVPARTQDDQVPRDVYAHAMSLTNHQLHKLGDFVPQEVEDGYRDTLDWLKGITTGEVIIPQIIYGASETTGVAPKRGSVGTISRGLDLFGTNRSTGGSYRGTSESYRFDH